MQDASHSDAIQRQQPSKDLSGAALKRYNKVAMHCERRI
jgi:hypothetical protein